ncbi:hypothetical protein ACFL13_02045 [Patescibacteria group bacterium]
MDLYSYSPRDFIAQDWFFVALIAFILIEYVVDTIKRKNYKYLFSDIIYLLVLLIISLWLVSLSRFGIIIYSELIRTIITGNTIYLNIIKLFVTVLTVYLGKKYMKNLKPIKNERWSSKYFYELLVFSLLYFVILVGAIFSIGFLKHYILLIFSGT